MEYGKDKERRVFDFRDGGRNDSENEEQGVITYALTRTDVSAPDPVNPILLLPGAPESAGEKGSEATLFGNFINPKRRSAFRVREDNADLRDILALDGRFVKLLEWLGENGTPLCLFGAWTEAGFAVTGFRMVDSRYQNADPVPQDSFLQLMVSRLLRSHYTEEEPETEDPEAGQLHMTDLNGMMDFLRVAGHTLPSAIRTWAHRNVNLVQSGAISPEERRHAQRCLSMMLNIEWKGSYFEAIDPVEARRILDEELFGLENVKQRIIETIIQINRTHTLPAYGILLAGPAGTGKSQIAYAVARILKLPWTSLDMSAIHDSEALTGSPRVYSNAKPGRIMEAFSQAGASNLVFIINELDKADERNANGNPADALLTLLDNLGFTDNYVECMIPTGGVYPIATANDKSKISEPLLTRFAVIDIPDYTPEEKKLIFSRFALPRVLKRMGMREEECIIEESAVDVILEKYRDEPGCRDLEQAAEHLCANALYQIETTQVKQVRFDREKTRELLG